MRPPLFHTIPGVDGSVVGNEARNAVIVTGDWLGPVGIGDGEIAVVGVIERTPPSFQGVPGVVGRTVGNEVRNAVKSAGDTASVWVGATIGAGTVAPVDDDASAAILVGV